MILFETLCVKIRNNWNKVNNKHIEEKEAFTVYIYKAGVSRPMVARTRTVELT